MAFNRSEIEPFRVDVAPDREEVRVSPVGELDLATVPLVDTELAELWSLGFARLVLDLRNVCFLDSTGLRLAVVAGGVLGRRGTLQRHPRSAGGRTDA